MRKLPEARGVREGGRERRLRFGDERKVAKKNRAPEKFKVKREGCSCIYI